MFTIQFTGAEGQLLQEELLTSGMEGKTVRLQFDSSWEDLRKTVVFTAGGVTRTVEIPAEKIYMTSINVTIPPEVLIGGHRLFVGVYGYYSDIDEATPSVMVPGPRVRHGAEPLGEN